MIYVTIIMKWKYHTQKQLAGINYTDNNKWRRAPFIKY
ncbi:hypothetical protein EDD59_13624 [Muricomes intestini]|uniref:Uncharacterized protein n=1 Tax=Muricomes intestini TaxID=1796634 RepID=A0A4R3JZN9_9FIRM|nr:hypothetical protein EDD59_13624 [Muricomes intestini]